MMVLAAAAAVSVVIALSLSLSSSSLPMPQEHLQYPNLAYAQAAETVPIATHIVINEVDTNPPDSDAVRISEWVEIYNPTSSEVDIGGWQIASTTALKKSMTIPQGSTIKPGQYITYTHSTLWFADRIEIVELRDAAGTVIDSTPALTDSEDDTRSWQRIYDGYALGGGESDWKFGTPTPGSSNGMLHQSSTGSRATIAIGTDLDEYVFGQTVTITGNVSEIVFVEKPAFMSEKITLQITSGTGAGAYQRTVTLYPDHNLEFSTTLELQQVQGIAAGTYITRAQYAGASAEDSFIVKYKQVSTPVARQNSIAITTDAAQYTPGQKVTIMGTTTDTARLATFDFTVTDPAGTIVASGNPAPLNGAFKTTIMPDAINPVYGTYTITAEYAGANDTATFEVVAEQESSTRIELSLDKDAYSPGQTVTISGMLNDVWIALLDAKIVQTRQESTSQDGAGGHSGFKIEIPVRVSGDGSFSYAFEIPNGTKWLGDYKATFSGDVGSAGIAIHVVDDPDAFVPSDAPITIHTDKESYLKNEDIILTGNVREIASGGSTDYISARIYITISDSDGDPIRSMETTADIKRGFASGRDGAVDYHIVATPEESGRYTASIDVVPGMFEEGTYTATAAYRGVEASASFEVYDQYDISEPAITTDKKVYGLGQTIMVQGVLPPSGANHVSITLTKPDGSTLRSDSTVEGQRFSWEWDAPKVDRKHSIREGELRGPTLSVFGAYKITATTDTYSAVAYFKLSDDPENDTFGDVPLFVTTSKALYEPGDILGVSGSVMRYDSGVDGLVVPQRVVITVEDKPPFYKDIYESRVYPDNVGVFSAEFALPIGIFTEGTYRVTAAYGNERAAVVFGMANDYVTSASGPLTLHVETDSSTYSPGQTVTITGGPNKIISVEEYIISVAKKAEYEADCKTVTCGVHKGPTTIIGPDPTASFTHQFYIPNNTRSLGTYEATVETHIGTERVTFEVVEAVMTLSTEEEEETFMPEIIIQRYNRLAGTHFAVEAHAGLVPTRDSNDTAAASPVSLAGSVITAAGQEHAVNLRVSTQNGTCIIGQEEGCAITGSTMEGGSILETILIDDENSISVIYNGPDERLERFSIYAGRGQDHLPDMTWNIDVVKDSSDIPSALYYKVAYRTTGQ